jgi:hypothetical protein
MSGECATEEQRDEPPSELSLLWLLDIGVRPCMPLMTRPRSGEVADEQGCLDRAASSSPLLLRFGARGVALPLLEVRE